MVFPAAVLLVGAVAVAPAVQHTASQAPPGDAATSPSRHEASFSTRTTERFAPGRVLVALADGVAPKRLADVTDRVGGQVGRALPGTRVREVRLPRGLGVEQAVRRYESLDTVRYAEPDYQVRPSTMQSLEPNDPGFRYLYGLHNTGETGGTPDADIDAPEAWDTTTGSSDSVVAVIDTGVDVNHPDLADNIWTNPGEIAGNRVDDDNNGYVDDVHGWDFYHGDNSVVDGEEDDHGTHVAGTIAAVGGNGNGVVGVSWRAQVMSLKFLGPGGGYVSDAVAALNYAVANGAVVSNNSWGGSGESQALKEAIDAAGAAGHLFVAAAGNGGTDGVGDDNDVTPSYPASYSSDNIVSVAATDHNDALASFSNYGRSTVDLGAPGVSIVSTLPGNAYGRYSGTSMASPHVTGAAALLLSQQPGLKAAGLKGHLLETTDSQPSLENTVTGGRLNVGGAVADGMSPTLSSTPTTLSLTARPTTVTFRDATRLAGRLTTDAGEGLAGQPVILQQRPVGSSRWRGLADGLRTTDSDGGFTLDGLRPAKNTDYRARFAGTPDGREPSVSPVSRVNVRTKVTLRLRQTDLQLGQSRPVSGAVLPAHSGAVRLVIRRNGTVITRKTPPLSDSRYRLSYEPPRPGRYTFRTVRFADTDHLIGRSPLKRFRVVR